MSQLLLLSTFSAAPMYQQIIDQITAKVISGEWPAGHGLPSIRELAASSSISVITVKRAYLELELAGVIVTQQGKGCFVSESHQRATALLRKQFDQDLQALCATADKLNIGRAELAQMIATLDAEPLQSKDT